MSKWFMQYEGHVKGPFNNESLEHALHNVGENNLERALVWRRGMTEWLHANKWRADLPIPTPAPTQNEATFVGSPATKTKVSPKDETVVSDRTKVEPDATLYRVQLNFVDQPMMTRNELLAFITKQQDVSKVSIQNPKTKEWSEIFAFPDIVERLGISRRKHTRVPILANFSGTSSRSGAISVKVVTISEGGMGFTEVFDLKIGDQVEGQITSPHFFQPIHMKADVIYSGIDGYIGLKFTEINDEARSAIIDYVKKFGKSQGAT